MNEEWAGPDGAAEAIETLRRRSETLAVVEGVTGGVLAATLSAPPGASDAFERAYVPYGYDALREQVGVEREVLDRHGAVSEPVVRSLARRGRDLADTTWGLATVGIAGPTGGSDELPVGTVYGSVAYAAPWGTEGSFVDVDRHRFDGDRATVRREAARWMVDRLIDEQRRRDADQ